MKTTITTIVATSALMLGMLNTSAFAGGFKLGKPGYAGTGCPAGSVSTTLTTDGKTLTVLFDSYEIEVGGVNGRSSKRKKCDLSIPIHVPQGWSVSLLDADYRGYVDLPKGAKATLRREYFFAGSQGPVKNKNWYGKRDKEYYIKDKLAILASTWSRCGRDVNLRTKNSLKVKTVAKREASAGVDSVDFNGRLVFHLKWKKCK